MPSTEATTAIVLLDIAAIIAVGSLCAAAALRYGQPAVIGEIVAGILLGPTLLGLLPGDLTERLFPPDGRPFLVVLANIGLVLFMFGVGFELDIGHLRNTRGAASAVSLASVALPFALGAAAALVLYHRHRHPGTHEVRVLPFALFLGVAMSITAFPVLARILTGCRLHNSRLGSFVMGCAAGADLLAWILLAAVVALVAGDGKHLVTVVGGAVAFVLALVFGVRPLVRALLRWPGLVRYQGGGPLLMLVVGLLLAAAATTTLGFHPIFGAFAFGAVMPREAIQRTAPEAPLLIEQTSQLLVPVFFVTTGLNANIAGLGGRGALEALLVLVVACAGKFLGAAGAARLSGMDTRRSAAVGVLMNSRGLTELVVVQVGISMGVLDRQLASMMILMAVLTTVSATPLFRWLYDDGLQREDRLAAAIPRARQAPARRPVAAASARPR